MVAAITYVEYLKHIRTAKLTTPSIQTCRQYRNANLYVPSYAEVKEDRQCTYNVTLRVFVKTLLPRVGWCVGAGDRACAFKRVTLLIQHATRLRIVI
jgi:hypothetical protein